MIDAVVVEGPDQGDLKVFHRLDRTRGQGHGQARGHQAGAPSSPGAEPEVDGQREQQRPGLKEHEDQEVATGEPGSEIEEEGQHHHRRQQPAGRGGAPPARDGTHHEQRHGDAEQQEQGLPQELAGLGREAEPVRHGTERGTRRRRQQGRLPDASGERRSDPAPEHPDRGDRGQGEDQVGHGRGALGGGSDQLHR